MAELRIQPKKSAPSPWLLVVLAVIVLALAAYFYLRPDPADSPPVPAATAASEAPVVDTLAPGSSAAEARATIPADDDSVTSQAATQPAASPARAALLAMSSALTQLTDRADLRDDANIREQRDNFTSATARLADGDPQASLRPGLVAAANLLLAIQQKAYPNLDTEATSLLQQASTLSGRDATPADQARNHAYLVRLSEMLNMMSYPAKDIL